MNIIGDKRSLNSQGTLDHATGIVLLLKLDARVSLRHLFFIAAISFF
jgi:hypothetical protein